MDPRAEAQLVAGRGIVGNADQGGKRQVTLIEEEKWRDAMVELAAELDPSKRRANVMVRGIDLEKSRGRTLRLGDALVRIYGEVRPCYQMENAYRGLSKALDPHWRGGVFGEILEGGTIRVGDRVEWVAEENVKDRQMSLSFTDVG